MQEAARLWLHCPSNSRVSGFGTVAELYLLHVLVPLGHRDEALQLITGEVGSAAFTEEQRQTALEVVEEAERQNQEPQLNPDISLNSEITEQPASTQGIYISHMSTNNESRWFSDCFCALQDLYSVNLQPCSGVYTEKWWWPAPDHSLCGESSWLSSCSTCF